MGTYYAVSFKENGTVITNEHIDSILLDLNNQVSTYIPNSDISSYNNATTPTVSIPESKKHFWVNFKTALALHEKSDGYFNHQIMPLVNFWGFGYK